MKVINKLFKFLPLLVVILMGFVPLVWFYGKGDVLINGVDTNFPLDPVSWFLKRFFVWNSTNGGIDFSSSTAGLFFHLIQIIPFGLGLSLQQTQIISLVFWFLLIVLSAYILARIILPKRPLIQLLFVVLYSFNTYLFNTWENIKVANLSLVASVPLVLSILILLRDKRISYSEAALYSVLIGLIVSGSGINPSYFISFFLIIFLFLLAEFLTALDRKSILERIKDFLLVTVLIVLVNFFWILPTANFVFNNVALTGSIDKLGFTNWIDSLSKNTSLLNVIRLQGAWDWYAFDEKTGLPLYIPYALNYFFRLPFVVFSLLIPSLVFLSLLIRDKRQKSLYLAFGLMLVLGIFLGVGTYLPTGMVFRWLANNVPLFTLFRSPWYIFTPLVILAYAGLVSLLFWKVDSVFEKSKLTLGKVAVFLAVSVLIVGNFLYSYPLVTGKIFRPAKQDNFYVKFPAYIFDAREWLKKENDGRIVGYPDDEIENFSWGYIGIESILTLVSDRETLFMPLNAPDAPVARLIKQFYRTLKKHQVGASRALAAKLNIRWIFEKKDQESLSPKLPSEITNLSSKSFGDWSFYDFKDSNSSKIYSTRSLVFAYPHKEGARLLSTLEADDLLVNPEDTVAKRIPKAFEGSGRIILAENSQEKDFSNFKYLPSKLSNRLFLRDLSRVDFAFDILEDDIYKPVLERYQLEDFGITPVDNLEVEVDGESAIWEIDKISDSYVYFKQVKFLKGTHEVSLNLVNKKLIVGGDFEHGVSFEKGGYGEGKEEYTIKEEGSEKFLSILNIKKADVSADFVLSSFDPFTPYYVGLRYKQVYGNNATIVIGQNTKDTLVKAQTERLPNYPEWSKFSFYYEPVETDSTMKVLLNAPFINDPLGTKIFYDDLEVYKVFANNLMFIKRNEPFLSSPKVEFKKVSPSFYEGRVEGATGPHVIVFSENYSPDWEFSPVDTRAPEMLKPLHFSANFYANAWYIEIAPSKYRFRIHYRPQQIFWLGTVISVIAIGATSLIFIRGKIK